jgi:hypothetical protein
MEHIKSLGLQAVEKGYILSLFAECDGGCKHGENSLAVSRGLNIETLDKI